MHHYELEGNPQNKQLAVKLKFAVGRLAWSYRKPIFDKAFSQISSIERDPDNFEKWANFYKLMKDIQKFNRRPEIMQIIEMTKTAQVTPNAN